MTPDAKFWNDIAEKYAAQPVANLPAFERKKAITREHLRSDATVLELGCGTGSLALEMAGHAGHIHAVDISPEMIRIAKHKQAAQSVHNVTFRAGTLDETGPYPREHFDSVWAYSLLHLVPDRKRTLSSLFELLKPGGSFIASHVCLGDSWIPYGPMITVMRWFGKAPFVYCYSRETMHQEMRDAGFVDAREIDVGAQHGSGRSAAFCAWISKSVAFVVARKPVAPSGVRV